MPDNLPEAEEKLTEIFDVSGRSSSPGRAEMKNESKNFVVKYNRHPNFVICGKDVLTEYTLWVEKRRFGKNAIYILKLLC